MFIYITHRIPVPSCCVHGFCPVEGLLWGCRAEIRTRACLTASRRATVWATSHPPMKLPSFRRCQTRIRQRSQNYDFWTSRWLFLKAIIRLAWLNAKKFDLLWPWLSHVTGREEGGRPRPGDQDRLNRSLAGYLIATPDRFLFQTSALLRCLFKLFFWYGTSSKYFVLFCLHNGSVPDPPGSGSFH